MLTFLIPLGQVVKRLALPVEIGLRALGRLGFCGVEQRRATTVVFRLDAVRNIGNFAAHPIKSLGSGEIMDVEPGEAEWSLAVLKELFGFYFVRSSTPRSLKEQHERQRRQ